MVDTNLPITQQLQQIRSELYTLIIHTYLHLVSTNYTYIISMFTCMCLICVLSICICICVYRDRIDWVFEANFGKILVRLYPSIF